MQASMHVFGGLTSSPPGHMTTLRCTREQFLLLSSWMSAQFSWRRVPGSDKRPTVVGRTFLDCES